MRGKKSISAFVKTHQPYFSQCFPFEVDIHMKSIDSKNLDSENKLVDAFYIVNMHRVKSYSYNALNKHK